MKTKPRELLLSPLSLDGPEISERLMGVNLELTHHVSENLQDNRLRNAKFAGPADPQTGVVAEWLPYGMNMGGMHARAAEGMFFSPSQSQMLHCHTQPYGAGLIQSNLPIQQGETLEFHLLAKVRHRPVRLLVALRAEPSRNDRGYANAEIVVDASYWKTYSVRLPIGQSDPRARLFLLMKETGVVYLDQVSLAPVGSGGVDREVQKAFRRLNPPAIRFPGGCMSTNHHWRLGTGPRERRPALADPVFKGRTEYGFGTDEYLEMVHRTGGALHITLNVGSGTPDDAVAWAAYCHDWFVTRGIAAPPAYFQIGNEQYGPWETSHMTGEMYARALQEFAPGLRLAYPGCRIIALAEPVSTGVAGEPDTPFRKEVLARARGWVDLLAINRYKGQWYDDPVQQMQNAVESVAKIRSDLETLTCEAREAGWEPKIALTEWNYWLHAAHWDGKNFFEPDDAFHGIFFSGVLHTLFRLSPVVELASFYHLFNSMGLVVKNGGVVAETALGTLYRLYRSALPGRLVTTDDPGIDALDSLAVARGETLCLFLSHWGCDPTPPLRLASAFGKVVACRSLAAPAGDRPMQPVSLTVSAGRCVSLPPFSVTRIDFHPG